MEYKICSESLVVTLNDLGGEIRSIVSRGGEEYVWQGDSNYWVGRAPNLFPYVGRLTDNCYIYNGKKYDMTKHGFLRDNVLSVLEQTESSISFGMSFSEQTLKIYPFKFSIAVKYAVSGNEVTCSYQVENLGDNAMYFGVGGHPAFNVPIGSDTAPFNKYTLTFDGECKPTRVGFDAECYCNGTDKPYPLVGDTVLELYDEIFDDDALVLYDSTKCVTLSSPTSEKSITVKFNDFKYIGFWHMMKKKSPFVCIEPWTSLPAWEKKIVTLEEQADLEKLDSHAKKEYTFTIEIH